jgi:PleD family two-component response regulator
LLHSARPAADADRPEYADLCLSQAGSASTRFDCSAFSNPNPLKENRALIMPRTILIADDDQSLMQRIRLALEEQGNSVHTASTSEAVIHHLMTQQVDLLVLSQDIAPQGGLEVLHQLRGSKFRRLCQSFF